MGASLPPSVPILGPASVWKQGVRRCVYPNHSVITGYTNYRAKQRLDPPSGQDLIDPRLFFANWSAAFPEGDPANNGITVRAAIEYPAGTMHQLYCRGSKDMSLSPGGMDGFDPAGIIIPGGTTAAWVHYRIMVGATTEAVYNCNGPSTVSSYSEGYSYDTTADDNTASSGYVYAHTGTQAATFCFQPLLMLGRRQAVGGGMASVAIIGDSIATGTGDTIGDPCGFIADALGTARPWAMMSTPGMQASHWASQAQRHTRMLAQGGFTHAICNMGVNDIANGASLATVQANVQVIWNTCNSLGIKIYQTTITPKSSSTDSWTTTQNQTPASGFGPSSVHAQFNAWLRTVPAPLSGVFDTEAAVTPTIGSGIWNANFVDTVNSPGIHPNPTGHAAMAAVFSAIVQNW